MLLLLFIQVDRDIKVLIKLVLHESRSASAWGASTNHTVLPASLFITWGKLYFYRDVVMKLIRVLWLGEKENRTLTMIYELFYEKFFFNNEA